jgi:callose synthase
VRDAAGAGAVAGIGRGRRKKAQRRAEHALSAESLERHRRWKRSTAKLSYRAAADLDAAAGQQSHYASTVMEARLWASRQGQTLFRTVEGIMLYEKALLFLAGLELSGTPRKELAELVLQKYQYVVSCQVYGQQKRSREGKARDIEYLLQRFPNMRVAYIDHVRTPVVDEKGGFSLREEYYSVLIKHAPKSPGRALALDSPQIQEVYRIRLPGNPMLGEGKPENQNHALIFTRGEYLQTIDMNQEGYFEEALKMRNLLEEFEHVEHSSPLRIVGFREHVYTGSLSSVAQYMAMQESTFATLTQRVLETPLRVRAHYGHPDLMDKLFFATNGGISKPSKAIHLNEDVFAGFNTFQRGGSVGFHEYIQARALPRSRGRAFDF